MTGEAIEELVLVVVNCGVCELMTALQSPAIMCCKSPINSITNPNPVSSHLTRDNTFKIVPLRDCIIKTQTA
jgi:hypothetical protein